MDPSANRRDFLKRAALLSSATLPALFGFAPEEGDQVIPFSDTKPFNPEKPLMPWDQLTSWSTPSDQLFWVAHYGLPEPAAGEWKIQIGGLVSKPRSFTLAELKARPKREYNATLECSGSGPAGGLIGTCKWAGTPLGPILKECGIKPDGIEVVFFCSDHGTEKIRGGEYPQNFARSLAVNDSLMKDVLLGYEMNGEPLTQKHGAPVRLIVPGWYGIAWAKWLNQIEVWDRRYVNRFMGRDYVTIRGEKHGDQTIWRETAVGRMNLKSVVARAVRRPDGTIKLSGAAWSDGTPIKSVEWKVDNGDWMPAKLDTAHSDPYCWKFWSADWKDAKPGEHSLTSRATDIHGKVQPAPDDDFITLKKTYWEANQQAVRKLTV